MCLAALAVPAAPGAYDEYVMPVLSTALNCDLLTAK